jgi:hypothetical protein
MVEVYLDTHKNEQWMYNRIGPMMWVHLVVTMQLAETIG